ncbi:MAG: right-handed parallel beta-helix repeat-containing protein [Flavobacteriales bacterium]|nr:right-handed parallel beta-helix repeat-containing protein [Flavobacteriales bacterium]
MNIFRSLTLLGGLIPVCLYAVTYYVSPNGNDNNNGTSPATAWRTVQRAQQVTQTMQPGDRILFERGGLYPGMLSLNASGTAANPMVFGAYGTGEKPIISGGVPVVNWVQHQGNIWRAAFTGSPKYLIVDGQPMTLARHPNSGWLRNAQGSQTHISNPDHITQPNGHWNGATVVVRTTNWSYEKATVNNHANGTLNITPIGSNLGNQDWGFFIQNKLNALDMAGEWFHDANTNQLYLWAPNNANPNNMQVLASITHHGFAPGWQRQHIRIEDIVFQGQTAAGISTEVAHHVVVTNCEFRHCYKAISSSGSNNQYVNNIIHNTFGTAINIYGEPNTMVANNVMTDIAINPGMGEDGWGYMGIVISGTNTVVRDNRLDNIGYIGIGTTNNGVVERNVVMHATSILNDGAAITFDDCDGVIIRDNIILDMVCDLESVATNFNIYYRIGFGIYFGNRVIKNSIVERNTVARCAGAGIHVDHTMLNSGNIVRDNVLFDNKVQLSLSDYSNNNTPGGSPPFYVPSFNTIYSGNVMYSIKPDQLCMRQYHVYSAQPVNFGTFSGNRYYSPYEELSIRQHIFPASLNKPFTLEMWQAAFNTDAASARSPQRLSPFEVTEVLGVDQVVNGHFTANVNGWTGWPTQAQITQDFSLLDNGAMKVHFANNASYDVHFLHPTAMASIQNGQYYRAKISLQSTGMGLVQFEVKGQSQIETPYAFFQRQLPFDGERRDLTIILQSDRTEPARIQFINHYTEPTFWLDNITFERVAVQPLDPNVRHKLLYNDQPVAQSFSLDGCWRDTNGALLDFPVTLQPYRSLAAYRVEEEGCSAQAPFTAGARVFLGGAYQSASNTMRTDLRDQGLIPATEPYTALGVEVENSGESLDPALLQATGPAAIVDWVVLELRYHDANASVAARRAALVRADGQVVSTQGQNLVAFDTDPQGKFLSVRHRNHLSAMTAFVLPGSGTTVDFTDATVVIFGQEPTNIVNGKRVLWPGDVDGDGTVRYTGLGNDRDPVLAAIGGTVPSGTLPGYHAEDVNLDGVVKYSGAANDRDIILQVIGGSVPTAVRFGQIP